MGILKDIIFQMLLICLGVVDFLVIEMMGVYIMFVNNGVYMEFIFLLSIEDCFGWEIYCFVLVEM